MPNLPLIGYCTPKFIDRVGNFDESLPVCEDYDLWLRILMKEEFGFIDQPLTFKHGGHADQLSKSFVE